MKNVLITSAGRRVKLLRAFEQELKQYDSQASVMTADFRPAFSSACHASSQAFALPKVKEPEFAEQLLTLCKRYQIGLIVPTIDTELIVLAQLKETFANAGIQIAVSDQALIAQCRDKRKTNQLFAQHNISTPAPVDRYQPTFPVFIKPFDGSCSQDLYLIESADDLPEALVADERLMFMEYLPRQEYQEFTLDLYYDKSSNLKCVVPRLRIEVRGGEVSKGVTRRNELVPFVFERFAKLSGAFGCVTLQLFLGKTNGKIYGIEINPRFGGGYPLSYAAGANFPGWLIAEVFGQQTIERFENWEANLMMLRFDDEVLVRDA